MEEMPQSASRPRGVLRTAVFAAAGILFSYFYLQTHQVAYLLTAVGFALILPNTFLRPVNWRKPTETSRHKDAHPLLTVLSLVGAILIMVGLVMQWL